MRTGLCIGLATPVCALLLAASAPDETGAEQDRAQRRAHAGGAGGEHGQRVPAARVRNGSIFVEMWDEDAANEFTLWRGGVDTPFRQLEGVRLYSAPCVSPDGRRLAYVDRREIVVRRISRARDGVDRPRVIGRLPSAVTDVYANCAWSPGGRALLIVGSGDVERRDVIVAWRIQGDGTGLRELLRLQHGIGSAPGEPAWSKAGRIAFVDTTGASTAWITIADADGANPDRLRQGHSPAWSPDGRQLMFIGSFVSEYATIAPGPVLVADADGGDVCRFRRTRSSAVAFSPDGRRVAVSSWTFPDQGAAYDTITIKDRNGTTKDVLRLPPLPRGVSTGVTWTRANGQKDERGQARHAALAPWGARFARIEHGDDSMGPSFRTAGSRDKDRCRADARRGCCQAKAGAVGRLAGAALEFGSASLEH